jgi:glutamine synthetase
MTSPPSALSETTSHPAADIPDASFDRSHRMSAIHTFLQQHQISEIEAVIPDMAGIGRGKLIPRAQFEQGEDMRLAQVALLQTVSGEALKDIRQTNFIDADMVCVPDAATIRPIPWANRPTAQLIHDCIQFNGTPIGIAPRQVLKRVLACYAAKGWMPVVAPELEFFLVAPQSDPDLPLRPPIGRSGRAESGRQSYSLEAISEFESFFEKLHDYCHAQGLVIETLIHEVGAAQIEINFLHGEALHLADSVFLFKRTVRETALRHGMYATFMAKPMEDEPGSAMHIHQSVVDVATGKNIFADQTGAPNALFHHYIAGLQRYTPALMPIFAPYVNSYRRLSRFLAAPINLQWGRDNRTVGFRVPEARPQALRVENRIPGVDGNPYLVLAATLAAGYLGMTGGLPATAPVSTNAYRMAFQLPRNLEEGLTLMAQNEALANVLGGDFVAAYVALKESEYEAFFRVISSWERKHLLLHV